MKQKIGNVLFYIWFGLALLGEFTIIRLILALLCVAAVFAGDKYIARSLAVLFFAILIAKYNQPRFS